MERFEKNTEVPFEDRVRTLGRALVLASAMLLMPESAHADNVAERIESKLEKSITQFSQDVDAFLKQHYMKPDEVNELVKRGERLNALLQEAYEKLPGHESYELEKTLLDMTNKQLEELEESE